MDGCSGKNETQSNGANVTTYDCDNMKCSCIPNRWFCGMSGSIDLSDFFKENVKGPAKFVTEETRGGNKSKLQEPELDQLFLSLFGDQSILLQCRAGECLPDSKSKH